MIDTNLLAAGFAITVFAGLVCICAIVAIAEAIAERRYLKQERGQ